MSFVNISGKPVPEHVKPEHWEHFSRMPVREIPEDHRKLLALFCSGKKIDYFTGGLRQQSFTINTTGIVVSANGETISDTMVLAPAGTIGINLGNFVNLTLQRVLVYHSTSEGIDGGACNGLSLIDVEVINTITANAPLASANYRNMSVDGASTGPVTLTRCRFTGGSAGVLFHDCKDVTAKFIEGYNFRGPIPHGQLIQMDKCLGTHLLEDLFCHNDPDITKSWPEDNLSFIQTDNITVNRAYIHGNNSVTGVAVMLEGCKDCAVNDVDAFYQGNGSFSAFPSGAVTGLRCVYTRCRTKHTFSVTQGRGAPSSGGQCKTVWPVDTDDIEHVDGSWYDSPGGVAWDTSWAGWITQDWTEENWTDLRTPFKNSFAWDN